jgi:hypothetical protein
VCGEFINSSSGVAIHGEANTGIGIRGTSNGATGFYGATRSGNIFYPGVEGESLNNNGMDVAGAFGLTGPVSNAPPEYGVFAFGNLDGVMGETQNAGSSGNNATPHAGVFGYDAGGAVGNDNVGVLGQSVDDFGVVGLANVSYINDSSPYPTGVFADGEPTSNGGTAFGVVAESGSAAILAAGNNEAVAIANGDYIEGVPNGASTPNFIVDDSANITATKLTTTKGVYVRTTGASGTTRMSYAARTTAPVMEDVGEAQLVNGRGYIRLDPALSDVIDNRNAYHVFLTPEGDSKGLYVTQKSPAGFTVCESRGGRSTLSFEYRILAKPVDDDAQRLALAPPLPYRSALLPHLRPRNVAANQEPLDPFARRKARIGPTAYARELQAARKIESVP